MIVRILGEGRYDVPEADLPAIEQLDAPARRRPGPRATRSHSTGALADLIGEVRHSGTRLAGRRPRTSSLVVPHEGSTLDRGAGLLAEEA